MISKSAEAPSNFARPLLLFSTAREAFAATLRALSLKRGKILLPAYIGWSPREGSGVFDPVAAQRVDYSFYALDGKLQIDLHDLQRKLCAGDVQVLLIIHYFGYVDPCYAEAIGLARQLGVFIIEDAAHAMLTDLVGNRCGKLGDACLYSFHKLLPLRTGGAVIFNNPCLPIIEKVKSDVMAGYPVISFDLSAIAAKRRANAFKLDQLVRECSPDIEPLLGAPPDGVIPQTYPVIIHNASRDRVYQDMNAAGFGVVSLYHTLISQIQKETFPASAFVSRHILNLPVHQDASESALDSMVYELTRVVREG